VRQPSTLARLGIKFLCFSFAFFIFFCPVVRRFLEAEDDEDGEGEE